MCTFTNKTPIRNSHFDIVLYSDTVSIPSQSWIKDQNQYKIPFAFDFESQALPPSFELSSDRNLGVQWKITGIIESETSTKIIESSSLPFIMAYHYTNQTQRSSLPLSVPASLKLRLPFRSKTIKHVVVSVGYLQPGIYTPILPPPEQIEDQSSLKLKLDIENLMPLQYINKITIDLRQTVQIQTPSAIGLSLDALIPLMTQTPSPRYEPEKESNVSYIMSIRPFLSKRDEIKSLFACTLPLDINKSHSDLYLQYVSSTPTHDNADVSTVSVNVKYDLKIHVFIQDDSSYFRQNNQEWICTLPLKMNFYDSKPNAVSLRNSQFSSSSSFMCSPIHISCSADDVGSFVSEWIDDLNISIEMITHLYDSLLNKTVSNPSRMVTTTADHVNIITNILNGLQGQSCLFTFPIQSELPKDPVPVNILVLELELMVETMSSSPPLGILQNIQLFLEFYREIVMDWIKLCGDSSYTLSLKQAHSIKMEKLQILHDDLQRDLVHLVS